MKLFDETKKINKYQKVKIKCDDCDAIFERHYIKVIGTSIHRCKSCTTKYHNRRRAPETKQRMLNASVLACKGKKLKEELTEEEYARRFKHGKHAGKHNPNYGGKYSRGFADRPITGPLEDYYGIERANEIKKIRSFNAKGENNSRYGKPSSVNSGRGLSGRYKNFHFRSMLELSAMLMYEAQNTNFIICESSNIKFKYIFENSERCYFPDFYLPDSDTYIEIKSEYALKHDPIVQIKLTSVRNCGKIITVMTERDIPKIQPQKIRELISCGDLQFHMPKCAIFLKRLGVTN